MLNVDWQKGQRYWFEALNITGNLASVVGVIAAFVAGVPVTIFSMYILLVTTFLAGMLVYREVQYARRIAYPEALAHLHKAIHYIRDAIDSVSALTEDQFAHQHVTKILDDLAVAFSVVTRTNCRTSIKVLSIHPTAPPFGTLSEEERVRYLLVRTYARDTINTPPEERKQADYLNDNTDLCDLFTNSKQLRCFIENDLPERYRSGGYRNSHLPDKPFDQWPLPYKSAIVWPIRKSGRQSDLHPTQELLGFLCVDSPVKNVFVKRYDFEIGALLADALYMFIKANREAHTKAEGAADAK